ncbi:MAG TPA: DsrE family protein [Bacteroidales bacterium]
MKKFFIVLVLLTSLALTGNAQLNFSCANTSAFPKNSTPDIGIIISSGDAETVWNALRLANLSQSKGDTVAIFVVGKGIDAFLHENKEFDILSLSTSFVSKGGQIYACGTCVKLRGTEEVKTCTVSSLNDLYDIVKRSKKVLTF